MKLSGIDGLQLFEEARELRPETKGVVITSYPSKETLEKAKRLGLDCTLMIEQKGLEKSGWAHHYCS